MLPASQSLNQGSHGTWKMPASMRAPNPVVPKFSTIALSTGQVFA